MCYTDQPTNKTTNPTEEKEDELSIGILSTSTIVDKVLPSLEKKTKVLGVASRDRQKAQAFVDERKGQLLDAKGMAHEELLGDKGIDCVYAPLPTAMRNDYLYKAIEGGKHLYSEKPMGGTVPELEDLLRECEAKNLQWMDGTMWYHSKRTKEIESLLKEKAIGEVRHVTAAFTFKAPNNEWLNGGNGRTDKKREPMGCLGDQGWYPISSILFGYNWELPVKVMATSTTFNSVDTIVACTAMLWFEGGRTATLDCGVTMAHRSCYEIVGDAGVLKVSDVVGGQGRSGNFEAYETPFVGSTEYTIGDADGKDSVRVVEGSDHVDCLVGEFKRCVLEIKRGGKANGEWPKRSLACHKVMVAIFESAGKDGEIVML